MTKEHKLSSSVEIEETCVSKNLDETDCLQSVKKAKCIREIRVENLHVIAEGMSSAPGLASSSAASLPESNECLGTHCSHTEQEAERRQFLSDLPESLK